MRPAPLYPRQTNGPTQPISKEKKKKKTPRLTEKRNKARNREGRGLYIEETL